MKVKLIIASVVFLFGVCAVWLWLEVRTKSRFELLLPLSSIQRQCVEQIIDDGKLVYVEKQADDNDVAIGYLVNDDYYATIFRMDGNNHCNVEFQEKVWTLEIFNGKKDNLRPHRVQQVKLSGNEWPEIYVWFDILGAGKKTNAKHIFYSKGNNTSYKEILLLELCVGISAVHFTSDKSLPIIFIKNDILCDWPPSKYQGYREYSVVNGEAQLVRHWSNEESK